MTRRLRIVPVFVVLLSWTAVEAGPLEREQFNASVRSTLNRLDREAAADAQARSIILATIQRTFGTPDPELRLMEDAKLPAGQLAALSYIRATTGESLESLREGKAAENLWSYLEGAGMSPDKMDRAMKDLLGRARELRNTRIFDHLRQTRRVSAMPDLGSGFGLVQDTLDFRHLETASPEKIHNVPGSRAKGDKP